MVFRDDDDALRARVDALEGKLAASEAENVRLRDASKAATASSPEPARPEHPAAPSRAAAEDRVASGAPAGCLFAALGALTAGAVLLLGKACGVADDDLEVNGWLLVVPSGLWLLVVSIAHLRRRRRRG